MHVEVERASEALYHGHRARPGTAGARQVGSPEQIGLDGAENYRESASGLDANRNLSGYGKLSTHWRTGTCGST